MTTPSSHAKGTMPEGNIKAPATAPKFQQAASGAQAEATKGRVKPVQPQAAQNLQMKGPGGQSVTNAHNQQRMNDFRAQSKQDAHNKALIAKANSGFSREQSAGRGKIKGDDDLQK